MALPKVIFNIAKDGLGGLVNPGTKVPGLIITGATVADGVTIGETYQVFTLQEAEELGIDEANNAFAHQHIKAFYNEAGNGTALWLMLVSDATDMMTMLSTDTLAQKLIADAKGAIRILGVISQVTSTIDEGLDIDVHRAVPEAQALAEYFEEKYMPFRVLISGTQFNGTVADLKDYTEAGFNKVACIIGNEDASAYGAIGLALGREAATPVQRKLSRVKSGPVLNFEAYLTDGDTTESKTDQWEAIDDKGYIFFRSFAGRSGYYFTNDKTLTSTTDDFRILANGLVMDKALIIAYNVLVDELSDEVLIAENGNIHPALIKNWQSNLETNIEQLMVANGELSAVKAIIEPEQNVLQNGKVEINLQLLPVGYADFIEVNIGFTTEIQN